MRYPETIPPNAIESILYGAEPPVRPPVLSGQPWKSERTKQLVLEILTDIVRTDEGIKVIKWPKGHPLVYEDYLHEAESALGAAEIRRSYREALYGPNGPLAGLEARPTRLVE